MARPVSSTLRYSHGNAGRVGTSIARLRPVRGDNQREDRTMVERVLILFEEMGATGWVVEAQAALDLIEGNARCDEAPWAAHTLLRTLTAASGTSRNPHHSDGRVSNRGCCATLPTILLR